MVTKITNNLSVKVEALLASLASTKDWGVGRSTVIASVVVGLWRMVLMPIDTCKTVLQVNTLLRWAISLLLYNSDQISPQSTGR